MNSWHALYDLRVVCRLMQWPARCAFALLLAALVLLPRAWALAPDLQLGQLHHMAWLTRDGAPSDIHAIRQTPDGFLWLGTSSGLFRFDGVQFERINLFPQGGGPGQSQNIASLALGDDGALWVGFRLAGVMRLPTRAEGPLAAHRWYDWTSGLPIGTVFAMLPDAQGQSWAATSRGLFRLSGERWEPVGEAEGLPRGPANTLSVDADGTIWVLGQGNRWHSRAPGSAKFIHQPSMDGVVDMSSGPGGQLWLLDNGNRLRRHGMPVKSTWPTGLPGDTNGILADRDGGLWVAHLNLGLRRLSSSALTSGSAPAIESMDRYSGLSSSRVQALYEDRSGHIWVGTDAGLDHFRPPSAVVVPFVSGTNGGVLVPSESGTVIAAGTVEPPARLSAFGTPQPLPGDYPKGTLWFGAGWRDADGRAWLGGAPDLWHQSGGRMERVAAPPEVQPNRPVQTIARDALGQLWVAWVPGPLRRFTDPGWAQPDPAESKEIVMVTQLAADGGFWRGLASGELIRRDSNSSEQRWGREQGLALGMVLSVWVQPTEPGQAGRVWVGGELGAALLVGKRFVPLKIQGEQPMRTVSGIVSSADGALWLNEESGILRIGPTQLQAWLAQPELAVPAARLDWRDGVLGAPPQIRQLPSAVVGSDGRLWFSRHQGIYVVDPARITASSKVPAVRVTGLWVDDRKLAPELPADLPVAPQVVRIAYAAPLPGAALKLSYRVRLRGLDDRWQDVGGRREQVFNQLPPGDYRLELQALQGETGRSEITSLAFTVPPAYYQTAWFRALLTLLALGAGAALYRWRMAANYRRVQERIEARLAERERIARELHDTLLQGTQALSLQIEASLRELPVDDPQRQRLSRALDRADATLVDARERVQDLRRHQQPAELSAALREAVTLLCGDRPSPQVHAECQGPERPLVNAIWHEAFRLGFEAARNVLQHAQASHLTVQVSYGADALQLTVADDGIGLPVSSPDQEPGSSEFAEPGHFGLRGLYERAQQMHGTLRIVSSPGQGTSVQLRVRASGAYATWAPWRSWLRPLRRRDEAVTEDS